ncbi:MAG TPA: T9SS type A sorting domain-containing protein, partial [Candidatus Kapabacteria bacterium]|nr:T9SS type A sorting domain-containing protein [Candidatus Kapabacteria bacterium]
PNPVSESTTLTIEAPEAGPVSVRVLDVLGRTLVSNEFYEEHGLHTHSINVTLLSPGMYYCSVSTGGRSQVTRFAIVR